MRTEIRERFKLAVGFALWMLVVWLRSAFSHPYELLWFTGNVASFLVAATVGYVWRGLKPRRDAKRAAKAKGIR